MGTNTIDEYFHFARHWGFLDACAHQGNDFQITDAFWAAIQETTARHHEPGQFITFPGWEWSGNTGLGGDRNVLFREEGTGIISRSCRALVTPEDAQPANVEEARQEDLQEEEPADGETPPPSGEAVSYTHLTLPTICSV